MRSGRSALKFTGHINSVPHSSEAPLPPASLLRCQESLADTEGLGEQACQQALWFCLLLPWNPHKDNNGNLSIWGESVSLEGPKARG